jgi:hypothetical protein
MYNYHRAMVYRYIYISQYAHVCSRMLTYAHVCRVWSTDTSISGSMLTYVTYAHVRSRMVYRYIYIRQYADDVFDVCDVCSRMLTYAHVCRRMVYRYIYIRQYAHICSRMLTYAHVCSRMPTYADVWSTGTSISASMLTHVTYAHVCSRMLTYAHVCSRMLTYAHVC